MEERSCLAWARFALAGIAALVPAMSLLFLLAITVAAARDAQGLPGEHDVEIVSPPLDSQPPLRQDPPAFSSLELIQSVDRANWSAVSGDVAAGFAMTLCPAAEYHFLNVEQVTTTSPLQDGEFGFRLDTGSLPADFYDYWAGEGVVSSATGWQGQMWKIINGHAPIFYLNKEVQGYTLLDGLLRDYFLVEDYLRVSGDYPVGEYVYSGVITDTSEVSNTVAVVMEFWLDRPEFQTLTLRQSTDELNWSPVDGDLAAGFVLELTPTVGYHYLDVDQAIPATALQAGISGFYLITDTVPPGFYDYWAGRGVVDGATGWQAFMWEIINGRAPMFYLENSAGSFSLLDGLQYALGVEEHLRVDGEYPTGSYGFTGVIYDRCGITDTVEVQLALVRKPKLAITKEPSMGTVSPGDSLRYTLTVTNGGTIDATGVSITDTLPEHTAFQQASHDGQQVGGRVVWDALAISPAEVLTVTFEVTIDSPLENETDIVNQAYEVTCAEGVGAEGAPVTVTVTSAPKLHIQKTLSQGVVLPGDLLSYTLLVENDGDANATEVIVTDIIPDHTQFHSASAGYSLGNGQVTWTGLILDAGDSLALTLTVTVNSPLDNGTPIVNWQYGADCKEDDFVSGDPVTTTVWLHQVYLPITVKDFLAGPLPPVCGPVLAHGDLENDEEDFVPWTQYSNIGLGLIYPSSQMPVHGGEWAAWLGGYDNAHGELCQVISIPENCISATATWWWQIKTLQTGSTAVDILTAEIRHGEGVETFGTLSNLDGPKGTWLEKSVEISATGMITLCFVGRTNASLITDFYLDDVAVEVCVPQ